MRISKATVMVGAAAALLGGTLSGCATAAEHPSTGDTGSSGAETQTVSVYAAASLKRAFGELAERFEATHEGITVSQIVTDGSSVLATQILEGAPADVFASADEKNMQTVADAGLAVKPELFASNTLVVVVPKGNPGRVKALADLASVTTVLCAPEVPCGAASNTLLANANVTLKPASLEQNVTAVLEKVAAGEADAGLVYATDVIGDDQVESFAPAGAGEVVNHYPITALTGAKYPEAAQAFVDFVLSDEGQQLLKDDAFGPA